MSHDHCDRDPIESHEALVGEFLEVKGENRRLRADKAHLVEVNAALRTRPDLAERAPLIVALVDERDRLRAVLATIANIPLGGTTLLSPPTVAHLQEVARAALEAFDVKGTS